MTKDEKHVSALNTNRLFDAFNPEQSQLVMAAISSVLLRVSVLQSGQMLTSRKKRRQEKQSHIKETVSDAVAAPRHKYQRDVSFTDYFI